MSCFLLSWRHSKLIMNSVLRNLLKAIKKPGYAPGIIAISFCSNGLCVAASKYNAEHQPYLEFCNFIKCSSTEYLLQLEVLIKERRFQDYDCHILLTPEQYRTLSLEAPEVSSDEMAQAVRWRIGENLDFPVDQASIDFFPLPKSNRANSKVMLEVAACPNQLTATLAGQCREAGLNLKVIDIQETALRNLAALLRENQQGVALLHLQAEGGRIIIQKRGELFLSRTIATGYSHLDEDSPLNDSQRISMEIDGLALEIQRSFDYVENFFDIPPISSLAIILMPINSQNILNALNNNLGFTTLAVDIPAILNCGSLLDDGTQNLCAPVIGASLRRFIDNAAL
jgi:MSHA biogenesis protein MshI